MGIRRVQIPYLSPVDHRVHRYFPDYLIEVKEKGGKVKKYVVEVKPKKQTMPPKKRSRVTQSYINEVKTCRKSIEAKWKA